MLVYGHDPLELTCAFADASATAGNHSGMIYYWNFCSNESERKDSGTNGRRKGDIAPVVAATPRAPRPMTAAACEICREMCMVKIGEVGNGNGPALERKEMQMQQCSHLTAQAVLDHWPIYMHLSPFLLSAQPSPSSPHGQFQLQAFLVKSWTLAWRSRSSPYSSVHRQ